MASNPTKSFLADAGYGEQELDANSALMELDKGIGKSGLSGCGGYGGVAPPGGGSPGHARSFPGRGRAPTPSVRLGVCREIAALLGWP